MAEEQVFDVANKYLDGSLNAAFHDREHQKAMAAASRAPFYAVSAPNVMDKEPLRDVFLGRYMVMGMRSLYGQGYRFLPQYQEEGTCVAQSHAVLSTCVLAINALLSGLRFPGRIAVSPIYAGSRVDVGQRPGSWQGSTGSWAAEWLKGKGGCVTLRDLGFDDNPADEKAWLATMRKDEQQAIAWCNSREGVPKTIEDVAKLKPIREVPMVTTVEEVRAALSNLTPVNVCGQVHPSKSLDERGCSTGIAGGGGHSTGIIGCYFDGSNWWYDHLQSWWFYYKGGFCRPGNSIDSQFKGAVTRIPEKWLKQWLNERDCYALVGVQGLEPVDSEFSRIMQG